MPRTCTLILALALWLPGCGGGSGRPSGPPAPVGDTIRTVTGRLTYFTTGPVLNNFDGAGRLIPTKGFVTATIPGGARFIPIEVRAPDGTLLAQDRTDEDGDFAIQVNFGAGEPATPVSIRAVARIDLPFGTVARVLPSATASEPYSVQSPLGGDPSESVMRIDLTIQLDQGAAAYHMLQTLYDGFVTAKQGISETMPDLDVVWAPGNGDTSSFVRTPNGGRLTIAGGITGDLASNVDAWDPPKVMRLFGEYLFEYYFNETAPDGDPSPANLVPSAAWREGFLDFWSCVARGSRAYWDTEGLGSEGRVVRYFDIESFFDSSLGSLGPDDPNVYQDPAVVGIGSAFTVAELLWDIHDKDLPLFNDQDGIDDFPLFLTLQFLRFAKPGFSYPYLYTLLDRYVRDGSIAAGRIQNLMGFPEDQDLVYPATVDNGLLWPPQISPDSVPQGAITPPFDKTVSDTLDTTAKPYPVNLSIGLHSQRYFMVDLLLDSDLTASLTTAGSLIIDIMDLNNTVIASGPSPQVAKNLVARRYIIRVRSASDPQIAPFDLRVQVTSPLP